MNALISTESFKNFKQEYSRRFNEGLLDGMYLGVNPDEHLIEVDNCAYSDAAREYLEGPLTNPIKKGTIMPIWAITNIKPLPVKKTIRKVKIFDDMREALHSHAAYDANMRTYLHGIHVDFETGELVVTDGHRMAVVSCVDLSSLPNRDGNKSILNRYFGTGKLPRSLKSHLLKINDLESFSGHWIKGSFPEHNQVLPSSHKLHDDSPETFNAESVGNYMRGVIKAQNHMGNKYGERVCHVNIHGKNYAFNAAYIADAADLFRAFGYETFTASITCFADMHLIYMESPEAKLRVGVMGMKYDETTPFAPIVPINNYSSTLSLF